ncbi:hypothetical protein Lal_00024103 [Lupinus albus]|nr:hypothetical protein Lal_00024103 [Lupinus albus]
MTLSISTICKAELLSSPEVGSSRMSTLGSCMTSTPIETLRLSPSRGISDPVITNSSPTNMHSWLFSVDINSYTLNT